MDRIGEALHGQHGEGGTQGIRRIVARVALRRGRIATLAEGFERIITARADVIEERADDELAEVTPWR